MRAVVLAGGKGDRLVVPGGPPKPLVPLAGRPLLFRTLDWLRSQGVEDVVVALGHRAAEVAGHPAWAEFPRSVALQTDPELETGARLLSSLRQCPELLRDGPFLLTYCDLVHAVDVPALTAAFDAGTPPDRPFRTIVAMTTTRRRLPWGILPLIPGLGGGGFVEKPDVMVNVGVYLVDPRISTWLSSAGPAWDRPTLSWERDVLTYLSNGVTAGVTVYEHPGGWASVNTPDELREAEGLAGAVDRYVAARALATDR